MLSHKLGEIFFLIEMLCTCEVSTRESGRGNTVSLLQNAAEAVVNFGGCQEWGEEG